MFKKTRHVTYTFRNGFANEFECIIILYGGLGSDSLPIQLIFSSLAAVCICIHSVLYIEYMYNHDDDEDENGEEYARKMLLKTNL